jgi:hypothetical protein
LDRLCRQLRVFERVVLDWRRVCEILVCAVMRYHALSWSLSFLRKVEDLRVGFVLVAQVGPLLFYRVGDQHPSAKVFVCHHSI